MKNMVKKICGVKKTKASDAAKKKWAIHSFVVSKPNFMWWSSMIVFFGIISEIKYIVLWIWFLCSNISRFWVLKKNGSILRFWLLELGFISSLHDSPSSSSISRASATANQPQKPHAWFLLVFNFRHSLHLSKLNAYRIWNLKI